VNSGQIIAIEGSIDPPKHNRYVITDWRLPIGEIRPIFDGGFQDHRLFHKESHILATLPTSEG